MLAGQHVQVIEFEDFGPPMVRAIGEIADEAWGHTTVAVSVPAALVGLVDDVKIQLRQIAPSPAVVGRAFNRWRPASWPAFHSGATASVLRSKPPTRSPTRCARTTGITRSWSSFAR